MVTEWWNWPGWPTTEEWSALWGLGAMLAAIGTLIVAAVAAWAALGQLRAYIAEQEERARPYLMADFWFKSNSVLYITLENISSTPATGVTMTSNPLPLSNRDDEYDVALAEVFGGSLVIPQVAPGVVMRWFIDSAHVLLESPDRPHRFHSALHRPARASRQG